METKNQSQIALLNGMKNLIIMKGLKREMMKQHIEVLFVTESFLSTEKEREIKQVFRDFDTFFRARNEKEPRNYRRRGGIMCIAKKGAVKLERECRSDDLMFVNWRGIKVGCAYFVPPTSPFEIDNERRMIELQERVLECSGEVMILTDSNAWIVSNLEDGYERDKHTHLHAQAREKK